MDERKVRRKTVSSKNTRPKSAEDIKRYNPKRKPSESRERFERNNEYNDADIKRYNPKRKNTVPKKAQSQKKTQNNNTKVRVKKQASSGSNSKYINSGKPQNKVVKLKSQRPDRREQYYEEDEEQYESRFKEILKSFLKKFLILILILGIVGGSAGFLYVRSIVSEMPPLTKKMVYDSYLNKEPVPLSDIPKTLREAVIAVEDKNFYKHKGISYKSLIRSFLNNVKGDNLQGGSTIDMQLSKNLLTSNERSMKRKIQDMCNAKRLNEIMTKDEILAAYLNNIYLGKSAYGVQAGAQLYFGKDVSKLNFGQSTMLAGITNNPRLYQNYEEAKKRQAVVLRRMYKEGYIKEYVYKAQLYRDTPFKSEIDK